MNNLIHRSWGEGFVKIFLDLLHMTRTARFTVHPIKSVAGGVQFRINTRAVVPSSPPANGLLSGDAQSKSEVSASLTESGNTSNSRTAENSARALQPHFIVAVPETFP